MDTFDALLNEAALDARRTGAPLDAALFSALSESSEPDMLDEKLQPAADCMELPVITPQLLAHVVREIVPKQMQAVLLQAEWNESGDPDFPYRYRVEAPVFAASKRADMYVSASSAADAFDAGLYQSTETGNGYVQVLSRSRPQSDLAVTFVVSIALPTLMQNSEE